MDIEVEHATKHFTRIRRGVETVFAALEDVSLTVGQGEFICLLGPSGCGKTTLMNAMAGFEPLTSGSVRIAGKPVSRPSVKYVTIFQNYGLLPWRSARRNVELGLEALKQPAALRREVADRYLAMVGLSDLADQHPRHLSGGQQQRVAIARALAVNPEILFMDEPFGALDAMTRYRLQADLRGIVRAERKTVVFVTHDIEEAVYLADRVVVMMPSPGRIKKEIAIPLSYPRVRSDSGFVECKRRIFREFFDGSERNIEYFI
ncbi:Bicarbonate transport ATP-binding protein CmpD [bioreactor metagenome]|uniref:Bicarbonate transport ATP-binding protein CmpD n=1 Tax=bioreactor metagenome TaxID=1076179 RepID=A0A644ZT62_9ZZZZ